MLPPQLLSHELLPSNGMRKERKHFLPKYFPVTEKNIFNSCDGYILQYFFRFVNKFEEVGGNRPLTASRSSPDGGAYRRVKHYFTNTARRRDIINNNDDFCLWQKSTLTFCHWQNISLFSTGEKYHVREANISLARSANITETKRTGSLLLSVLLVSIHSVVRLKDLAYGVG